MTGQQQSAIKVVAVYARVSTDKQDTEKQLHHVREFVKARGWKVYGEYTDKISTRKAKRPGLADVEDAAKAGRIDAVVFYSMSRLFRIKV